MTFFFGKVIKYSIFLQRTIDNRLGEIILHSGVHRVIQNAIMYCSY